jgi:hypothetical protein
MGGSSAAAVPVGAEHGQGESGVTAREVLLQSTAEVVKQRGRHPLFPHATTAKSTTKVYHEDIFVVLSQPADSMGGSRSRTGRRRRAGGSARARAASMLDRRGDQSCLPWRFLSQPADSMGGSSAAAVPVPVGAIEAALYTVPATGTREQW